VRHRGVRREKDASEILSRVLRKLEYRGYDSAGVAILNKNEIKVVRAEVSLRIWKKS
jgi:glucosamine--fructose-6-phosphate aminotransferase (isomerizing)